MSTPPDQTQQHYGGGGPGGGYGRPMPNIGAIMPVPGNAELVVYIIAAIIVAIIALASDQVGALVWTDWFKWVTAAYLISRGIAKASRVLER